MTSPIISALGAPDTPVRCHIISADVAVHWYPQDAQPGDPCMCGKVTMREPA